MPVSSTREERSHVVKGIATSFVIMGVVYFTGYYVFPAKNDHVFTMADKLAFTLRWQSFSILTFIFGVMRIASKRFFTEAIDPVSGNGEHLITIDSKYLQNTFEQLSISGSGQLILSTYLEHALPRVIPTLVVLFVTGRVLFWYGYHMNPLQRAAGFGVTFYPSVIVHITNVFLFMCYGQIFGLK